MVGSLLISEEQHMLGDWRAEDLLRGLRSEFYELVCVE
jgi:hypothetical protein